jgi:fructokinase
VRVPIAALPGEVVDTMGAGDATLASTVQRFLSRGVPGDAAGWRELMESAMVTAAATCRTEGALLQEA